MAVDVPHIDGSDTKRLPRSQFSSFIFSDSAALHAVMLIAASCEALKPTPSSCSGSEGLAISEINSPPTEEGRGTSDQLIAGVAKMASYEALFGSHVICNTTHARPRTDCQSSERSARALSTRDSRAPSPLDRFKHTTHHCKSPVFRQIWISALIRVNDTSTTRSYPLSPR